MKKTPRGRSTNLNPPNRFDKLHLEPLDIEAGETEDDRPVPTTFFNDTSRSILSRNDSPDIPFAYSINPYRGCEHGCVYCYARPSHEYLGFSSGLDFESKIMVKMDAAGLLEAALRKRSWVPQVVAVCGNTDPYQPIEKTLELTRQCLRVFLKHRNPVSITTKNALVLRDSDILSEMARLNLVHVTLSVTTLRRDLARVLEPRTSSPANRLAAIRDLARHDVPAGVSVAPVVPGLTDEEIPSILKAAAEHGAAHASYILLKLPGTLKDLFGDWLSRNVPERAGKVLNRIKDTRGGKLSDARFGTRMTGGGEIALSIGTLFNLSARRNGLRTSWEDLSTHHFRREVAHQIELF